jgi:hypothetical protein
VRHLDMMTHNHAAQTPLNAAMGTYLAMMDPAMVGSATVAKPPRDESKPQPIEFFFDHVNNKPADGIESLQLVSHDRKYDKTMPASAATPKGGLLCLKFEKVLPAKSYSLYMIFGKQKIVFFANVPFAQIAEHTPGDEKLPPPPDADSETEEFSEPPAHPEDWYEPTPWTRK